MDIKIFSFFSGAGFLDLGFEEAGCDVCFVNEYHAAFLNAYQHSRKVFGYSSPEYGYHNDSVENYTNGSGKTLSGYVNDVSNNSITGFIGGPPCPDFSVGGKNRGKKGDNGKLSGTYVEIIKNNLPDFFLFENVKGLWRTKKHRAFYDELKLSLRKSNYILSDKLINSISYGVPQDRERIILLGFHERLINRKRVELNGDGDIKQDKFPWNDFCKYSGKDLFNYSWPTTEKFEKDSVRVKAPEETPIDLTVQHWFEKNDIEAHPNAQHHFKPRAALPKFLSVEEGDDSRKSSKRLHRWRYSPTACYGNNEVHLHPYKPRRISASEAMAIQSLPKDFELPPEMTLTDMFKTIGNGVPYLTSMSVAAMVKWFIEEQTT